jgi:ABC-type branched-subunit amino acid transport system substrate-binding protein
MQYEGLEQSPNIFYLGAAPNQQILPAVRWAFAFLRRRRFFLIGWNSIYPRATNAIVRDEVDQLVGEIVGEEYVHTGKDGINRAVRKLAKIKPDVVVNSLTRDLNALYCRRLREEGVKSRDCPTIYLSISENEVQSLAPGDTMGDYAAWNYFQSLDRPANREFVKLFKSHYGIRRATADPMEAAYSGVHLWAQAAEMANSNEVTSSETCCSLSCVTVLAAASVCGKGDETLSIADLASRRHGPGRLFGLGAEAIDRAAQDGARLYSKAGVTYVLLGAERRLRVPDKPSSWWLERHYRRIEASA